MTSHRRSDEDFAMTTKLLPSRHAAHHPDPPTPPDDRGRLERIWLGPADQPRWARPALLGLLALTAVLYLWDLSASGYANSFYAAAVQAGTKSWKAFFFGSLDAGNSITVDKPPASLWVMELSGRIFGFNSWSLLVPQALEGVAAVGLLYGTVRRVASSAAGLAAGAALALTPAAVLMFRFDNPDALLVLCMVTGAYAVTRALDDGRTRWLVLAGSVIGLAFLTKLLQGFLVLPAFALTYLLAGPVPLRRRIGQVLAGTAAVIVAAGWWVLIVSLWPAADRPYVGGSTNDSILELVFGYDGLGRIFGGSGNGGGGGAGGASGSSFGGATGLSRLFSSEMGNEISWLLPAALVGFAALLWFTRRAPRTDRLRAAALLWGGWLLVTGLVFSYMQGTIHPYYTVALAPAIAALVALAGHAAWERRATVTGRLTCVALVLAAGLWSFVLLGRTSSWQPELRWLVLALTLVAAVGLAVPIRPRLAVRALLAGGLAAALLGTAAFGVATAASPHTGSIPSVGPAAAATSASAGGPGGGGLPSGRTGGFAGAGSAAGSASRGGTGASAPGGTAKSGSAPAGSAPAGSAPGGSAKSGSLPTGSAPTGSRTAGGKTSASGGGTGGGMPSGGGGATTSTALTNALKATSSKWAAAVVGDQSAASLELATGKAVISIGGWSGTDPSPTLAQFEHYVATGQVRYLIASGGMAMGGGSTGVAAQITKWVAAHYQKVTIGGQTVYDLSQPLS
jgi:4-amino-4-deoxy-L-arabinose transferase-like glycosyltransferase